MSLEEQWNDDKDRRHEEAQRQTCSCATSSTRVRGEKPGPNRLSYDIAQIPALCLNTHRQLQRRKEDAPKD
jgi:hypothetical protein